jgi:hypothetical protein
MKEQNMKPHGRAGTPSKLMVVGLLAILAALVPIAAQAAPPKEGTLAKIASTGNQSSWKAKTATRIDGTADAATVAAYPADCIGVSDYPHQSVHNPGYAVAQVRTECSLQRSWMYAYGELYRDRWYGPQFLASASSSTKWTYGKVRAIPTWRCAGVGTYTYHIYGYHEVTDAGTLWYKYSSNSNRFTC